MKGHAPMILAATAAVALTAGFAGVTFVRLVGLVVKRNGPEPVHGAPLTYGWSGRAVVLVLSVCCLALAAVTPLEIRVIAAGLSPFGPSALIMGALKWPWVLQPVFGGFSILSPSWLWLEMPVMLLVVVLVAWAVASSLAGNGFEPVLLPAGPPLSDFLTRLADSTPDLIFNLTEGFGGETAAFSTFRAGRGWLNLTLEPPERSEKPITVSISHEAAPLATAVSDAKISLAPASAHMAGGSLIVEERAHAARVVISVGQRVARDVCHLAGDGLELGMIGLAAVEQREHVRAVDAVGAAERQ